MSDRYGSTLFTKEFVDALPKADAEETRPLLQWLRGDHADPEAEIERIERWYREVDGPNDRKRALAGNLRSLKPRQFWGALSELMTSRVLGERGCGAAFEAPIAGGRFPARETPVVRKGVDYLALEARNRSIGMAGEEFVVRFEVARLLAARNDRLAARVERVSETQGDAMGFDVLSFEESGRERLVEVKTTAYGRETPFFVTRNELETSQREADQYFLYRVFDFRRKPRLFHKQGHLERAFTLDPVQYLASVV